MIDTGAWAALVVPTGIRVGLRHGLLRYVDGAGMHFSHGADLYRLNLKTGWPAVGFIGGLGWANPAPRCSRGASSTLGMSHLSAYSRSTLSPVLERKSPRADRPERHIFGVCAPIRSKSISDADIIRQRPNLSCRPRPSPRRVGLQVVVSSVSPLSDRVTTPARRKPSVRTAAAIDLLADCLRLA